MREGLDAVIVTGYRCSAICKGTFPDLPIHASTQMTITTDAALPGLAPFLKSK